MTHIVEPSITDVIATDGASGGGNLLYVTLVSMVSAMGGFLFGYETVVIAGTLALVKAQFGFSALMEGWFVSSGLLGCVVGVLVAGKLCDSIGRKKVMLISAALLAIAALACAFAPAASWLIVGRFIGGIGVGFASIVSPLYISEVAPPKFRGRLVSLFQLTITLGIVAAMVVNARLLEHALDGAQAAGVGTWNWLFVSEVWRGMFLGQVVPAVLFLAFALVVPESPRWLSLVGRPHRARTVLSRLRGDEHVAKQELAQIETAVHREERSEHGWRTPGLSRPLFLGIFLAVFSELSGITVVMYYGPVILEHAGISAGASLGGHAVIGMVLAAFTVLALFVVDRFGRKPVLLTGVAGACVALVATGICFANGVTDGTILIALLCMFVAFFAFSIGPIKWIVISEIFPTGVRARAMGVATVAVWLTDIVINQAFPVVRDTLGVAAMFLGCAVFLVIQFVVVWRELPETKGMPLEDILSLWSSKASAEAK